jgi:hypothetical protein
MRRALLLPLSVIALAACEAGGPGAGGPGGGPTPIGDADGGTECTRPDQGCPCDGQPPIDCYLDPVPGPGGSTLCGAGTRYCRDGRWTGCESVRDFTIEASPTALVTGPDPCNVCDPRCFVSRDVPTAPDLTPGRSMGVSYDPVTGGITLTPGPPAGGTLPDSDGDGVPDVADQCPGAGWMRNPDGTCPFSGTSIYHTLPFGASAIDPLVISTQIRTADVYFLMDTTGSMGGELTRLRTDLTTGTFAGCTGGIIGAIRCTIPDAWFGVGYHDDYAYSPYGGFGDIVYRNVLDIQSSVPAAQAAVNTLVLHWGNDGPESQTQALWSIATGGGLGSYLAPRAGCAAGRWGYPCFRPGTIPIVVFITDAPFHNGPGNAYPYCIGCTPPPLPPATGVAGNEAFASSYPPPGGVGAVDLTGRWVGFSGNTTFMVNHYNFGCNATNSADAVFRVRVTATQATRFTLQGSSYDTVLGVFPVSGAPGWCNDDAVGFQSQLDLTLAPGDYWVIVDGYWGSRGAYRLSMGVPPAAGGFTGVSWAQTVADLSSRGVRVLTFQTCGFWSDPYCLEGEDHARQLANATGSVGSSGTPYVFRGNSDGTGLSASIVSAIVDLANYSRMDVSARVVGDTAGFTRLPIAAISWGPRGSCTGISGGSVFTQCLPGTDVNFRVTFINDRVMPTAVPQVFDFFVEIVGNGTIVLARVPVRIVVPPQVPSYPPTGSYWRDYDSTLRCQINERPDWGQLSWVANTPTGTRIDFQIRGATTLAALPTATPVATVTVPGSTSPQDLTARMRAVGYPDGYPFVRVTALLVSNATRTLTPTLSSMTVTYTCVPAE